MEHLANETEVHCVACGAYREVDGVPADFIEFKVINSTDLTEFVAIKTEIEAIVDPKAADYPVD
jgi:hypothetical protein